MRLPLAVYTANHGLEWTFPRVEISLSELERVRRSLGKLPDFDAGESGFVGIRVEADRVYVEKVQSVHAWDFRGRDATYLTMTWFDREILSKDLLASILMSDVFITPTKISHEYFDVLNSNSIHQTAALNWLDDAFELISNSAENNLRINDVGKVVAFKSQIFSDHTNDAIEEIESDQEVSNSANCSKGCDCRNIVLMVTAIVVLLIAASIFIKIINREDSGLIRPGKMAHVQSVASENNVYYHVADNNFCCVSNNSSTNDVQRSVVKECVHEICVTNAMGLNSMEQNKIEPKKRPDDDSNGENTTEKPDFTIKQKETGCTNALMKEDWR